MGEIGELTDGQKQVNAKDMTLKGSVVKYVLLRQRHEGVNCIMP